VDEHLGRAVGAVERAGDLAVVHAEGKAHDQGLAPVVGQPAHPVEHAAQLVAPLDELLGGVGRGQRGRLFDRRGGLARAIAVEVGGEVVGDADQPGPQGPSVRLPLGALEMAIGLQEGLLGQILGVVMVPDAVVGIAVDVAQMGAIQL
jgi:hypothetical protein